MRRLSRPTAAVSRGCTCHQTKTHAWTQLQQHQQRRCIAERQTLSKYAYGSLLQEGRGPRKANQVPTFELTDLILDLDAEDSPHVRPYDDEKDGPLQDSKWAYDPAIDDIKREATSMRKSMARFVEKSKQFTRLPMSPRRLSDHDTMAVALLKGSIPSGLSLDTKDPRLLKLQSELSFDGVPKVGQWDANAIIPFVLRHNQLTLAALKDPSTRGLEHGDTEREFREGVATCKYLDQLRKVCSRVDRPDSGVQISTASMDHVHERLLEFLRSGQEQATSANILKFVNNVTIKRITTNKELNRSMTLFGLQLASQLGLLSCILQYLQICLSMDFITDRARSLILTRSQAGHAILAALQRGDGAARGTRQQIFTLLTGRGPAGLAPQASIFGLLTDQVPEIRKVCISLLGELGAARLLAHYWLQRTQEPSAQVGPEAKWEEGSGEADKVFGRAFLRCAQVLGSVKVGALSVDLTTTTGELQRDAALDWQNINIVDAFHAKRGSNIPKPSSRASDDEVVLASKMFGPSAQLDLKSMMGYMKDMVDTAATQAMEETGGDKAAQRDANQGESQGAPAERSE